MQWMPVHDALRLDTRAASVFAAGQAQLTRDSICNPFRADHAFDDVARVRRFRCLDGLEVVLHTTFGYLGTCFVAEDVAPVEL